MVYSYFASSYLVPGGEESWFPYLEQGCFFHVLMNGVGQRRYDGGKEERRILQEGKGRAERRIKEKKVEIFDVDLCEEEGE